MGQFGLPRGWGFTRPMLNKAQVPLEVSQVHFKKGVEKGLEAFAFGSLLLSFSPEKIEVVGALATC